MCLIFIIILLVIQYYSIVGGLRYGEQAGQRQIPEIIAADGRQAAWHTAEDEGVISLLKEKLKEESKDFSDQLFRYAKQLLAESLGGVESLICHPVSMTHAAIPAALRQQLEITDDLLRLSVGLEDADDLIEDLDGAFTAARGGDSA